MQYVLYLVAVGPWKLVRGLAFVINRWQRICRPLSQAVYYTSDLMDRHTPTVGTSLTEWNPHALGGSDTLCLCYVSWGRLAHEPDRHTC